MSPRLTPSAPVTSLKEMGNGKVEGKRPVCTLYQRSKVERLQRGSASGHRPSAQQGPWAGLAWVYTRVGRGFRTTVGATVHGAAGRGQSSQQTVTFFLGRLSCNTFPGQRRKVEAFVLKHVLHPKTEEGLAGLCGARHKARPG